MPSQYDVEFYKVFPLVDDYHDCVDVNQIDFKRHLKPAIALNKKVSMQDDGRPLIAEYFNGSTLIAKIYFYFILDSNSFMTRRTEDLVYIKNDDTEGLVIRIKDKTYDFSNPMDAARMLEERSQGRKTIIEQIKATTLAVLSAANPTLSTEQVIGIGLPFWDEQDIALQHFIGLGTTELLDNVTAIDLATTPHDWLNEEVSAGVTLKDYMIDKLTYTSATNHPEA